ncbi:ABC transporter permease [Halorussus salilacus]|uniref:ABC transporter permease n=1 Tax=Halorussus salilacus TaxID=2953750 RepID=UPI00209CECE0|nr:ABC transporter permease [Halorussus salilacus]USZ67960.1 ABC transporter permease [Halorussus salilacus]
MSSDPPTGDESFEAVDWELIDGDAHPVSWNVRAFVVGAGLLAVGYAHQRFAAAPLPLDWTLSHLDWLTALSLLAVGAFVVVPLARNLRTTLRYWGRFRANRLGVASLLYAVAFFAVGLIGPLLVSEPKLDVLYGYQPPVGTAVDLKFVPSCLGRVADGRCHGTWRYPLGTTYSGKDLVPFVVFGARTTLQVVLVSSALLVPTGVAVGLAAAYASDRVDAVLMRSAESLQTIPAILIYLVLRPWVGDYRLLLMVGVFGLANWGGLAKLVRSEALKHREESYVRAAESAGADRRTVVRRHLLPNISGSVLANATLQIPMLVLTEAALSFLGLGAPTVHSWGQTIALGIRDLGTHPAWWVTLFPAVLLTLTVLAFNALGDALESTLDPRR